MNSLLLCTLHEHLKCWPSALLHIGTCALAFLIVTLPGVCWATTYETRVGAKAVEDRMPITSVALATDLRQLRVLLLHQLSAASKISFVGIDNILIGECTFQHGTHLVDAQRCALQC